MPIKKKERLTMLFQRQSNYIRFYLIYCKKWCHSFCY